jgi:hypothetical protein
MADYMDYFSADQGMDEEERRRRQAADVGEFQALPQQEKPGFFSQLGTAMSDRITKPFTEMGQMLEGNAQPFVNRMVGGQSGAPVSPVAPMAQPQQMSGMTQGMAQPEVPAQPQAPVAPMAQPQSYDEAALAAIRQKESGGNYNVGKHPNSSASGAYGITNAAYTDIQRANPYFAGRDRATLSPQEQDQAALTLRGINDGYLRNLGVEVTEPNRQLAHFLGAGGAARYLQDGTISEEAAAANGGFAKANQIAQDRLALGKQLEGGFVSPQAPQVAGVGREMGMGEPGYGGAGEMPTGDVTQTPDVMTAIMRGDAAGILSNANAAEDELAKIAYDPEQSPTARRYAKERMVSLIDAGRKLVDANQTFDSAVAGDPKATRELTKTMSDKKNEGSWLKAIFLARLGLAEAATREFALLGVGSTQHEITLGGKQGIVTMDAKGDIIKGEIGGKDMSAEQLREANTIAADTKRGTAGATRVRDSGGTEWSVVPTSRGSEFYDNTGRRGTPQGKTVPISVGGDVDLQNQLQLNKLRNQLQYVEPTKRMEFAAQFDQENGTNFSATLKQTMPQFFGGVTPTGGATPVIPTTPVTQPSGTTQPTTQPTGVGAPSQPTVTQPGTVTQPSVTQPTNVEGVPPNVSLAVSEIKPMPGESAKEFADRKAAAAAAMKKYGVDRAEEIAKIQTNLPALEKQVDQMLRDTNALVTHPGFETSVGAKGPSYLFGLKDEPLPIALGGGDAKDWQARQKQIESKSFLQAFDVLRGGGQITNIEGDKATVAINRMSSATTEKEYLAAKRDFDNFIKESVNTRLEALGRKPKYKIDYGTQDNAELFNAADEILKGK